jgi:hypothetical protein
VEELTDVLPSKMDTATDDEHRGVHAVIPFAIFGSKQLVKQKHLG